MDEPIVIIPPVDPAEEIGDVTDDVDELVLEVRTLARVTESTRTELLEKISSCQTQLELLSTRETAENPLLTQLLNQLLEVRADVSSLKSSMDSRVPPLSVSEPPIVIADPDLIDTENLTVELPDGSENPPETAPRKNRFV